MFIVYGNTYEYSHGCEIALFGIADSYENAKKLEKRAKRDGYITPIHIDEVAVNTYCDMYLGGYIE